MTLVMVWGDAALMAAVQAALSEENSTTVSRAAPAETPADTDRGSLGACDYAVLQASAFPTRAILYDAVRNLGAKNTPTAVLFDTLADDDLKKAAYAPAVDIAFETANAESMSDAVALIAERVIALSLPAMHVNEPLVEIGTIVKVSTPGAASDSKGDFEYRAAGFHSLVPQDGSDFAREVRDIVSALAEYPLRTFVPWDPRDGQPGKSSDAVKNLQDVMQAFARDPDARQLAVERRSAEALLAGKPVKGHEAAEDWRTWHKAWDRGRPPLLLIEGETGVGKSLMAEYLAFLLTPRRSTRAKTTNVSGMLGSRDRFVKFNGAGLTLQDFNHYLMGTAPGIFTGIPDAVVGQLTRAAHGVFFLDEIGDMARDVQAAFLTFLDTREIRPSGMHPPFNGFQHIFAATNHNLDSDVADERFRKDLLARFALRLWIPPLRHRSRRPYLPRFVDYLAQDPVVNPQVATGTRAVRAFTLEAHGSLIGAEYEKGNFRELTATVHGAIREARRRLDDVVTQADVVAATTRRSRGGEGA